MARQKYISAIILSVIFTTVPFTTLVIREVRDLQSYMGYVAENGKSALFNEEYINQNIATRLSREFYTRRFSFSTKESEQGEACQYLEDYGELYGFNLLKKNKNNIKGTLQTLNKSCKEWVGDVNALSVIDSADKPSLSEYSFSNYTSYNFKNIIYYVDFIYGYIYINRFINSRDYIFSNRLIDNKDGISIVRSAHQIDIDDNIPNGLLKEETILSHIYQDGYTHNNIISILTPVFLGDKVKGVLITDVNIADLVLSFKTVDRPLLWKFISSYVIDNKTGMRIYFHRPYIKSYSFINYETNLTPYYSLHVKVDAIYIVIANLWLFILYVLGTWVLCRYTYKQLIRHELLSRDNVTDAMTGLYNRKIITSELEQKIYSLANRNIPVTIIAIDSDGLKKLMISKAIIWETKLYRHSV